MSVGVQGSGYQQSSQIALDLRDKSYILAKMDAFQSCAGAEGRLGNVMLLREMQSPKAPPLNDLQHARQITENRIPQEDGFLFCCAAYGKLDHCAIRFFRDSIQKT